MKKLLFLFFLFSVISFAQQKEVIVREIDDDDNDGGMMMQRYGHGPGMIVEELNLTDDQQKQFGKLHDEMEKKQIDLRAKIKSLRVDVKGLFREEKPEQGKIESKINEISKLQNEMKLNHLNFWFSVNKILNADQQKIWKQHYLMMGESFGKGVHHRPMMKKKMRMMRERMEEDD